MNLQEIFKKQIELNERCAPGLYEKIKENSELRRQWFLRYELALRQESAEAVDSIQWKWWKKQEDDWDNIKIELVDMLHFWVSMCTIAGMDSKEVLDLYFKKNKLNHDRQDKGYKEGTYQKIIDGVEDNRQFFDKK
jgi:dimeric dUTPase (all-alpha-NTP-PPase superfamily)